jgi:hypothetical protein
MTLMSATSGSTGSPFCLRGFGKSRSHRRATSSSDHAATTSGRLLKIRWTWLLITVRSGNQCQTPTPEIRAAAESIHDDVRTISRFVHPSRTKRPDEHTADTHAQSESHQDSNTHHEQVSAQHTSRHRIKFNHKKANEISACKRNSLKSPCFMPVPL